MLFKKRDDPFIGNMVETAIYSQWQHASTDLYYARWNKGEVDMVCLDGQQKPRWVVEVKWSNKFYENPYDLKNLNTFCKEHSMMDATSITTIDKEGIKMIDG